MDRIELRIMGGLGNQLYQYSAARFLQKNYNVKEILIDNGEYETYKTRNLEINQLLHNKSVIIKKIKSKKNIIYKEGYHVYQKLYRMIAKGQPPQKVFGSNEEKYLCTYINSDLLVDLNCKILHMYGYFVSADIALAVKDDLMQELWLDNKRQSEKYRKFHELVTCGQSIAISIRCAEDYVKNNWPICSKDFYLRGLEYILKKRKDNRPILIFADDIAKVKSENWFSDYENVTCIEGLTVCESFEIMRRCTDYVCSNSSFSWWGAFLSHATNSIKINPNKVFSGKSKDIDELTFYKGLTFLDYITGKVLG